MLHFHYGHSSLKTFRRPPCPLVLLFWVRCFEMQVAFLFPAAFGQNLGFYQPMRMPFGLPKTSLYILWLRMPAPLSYKISVILFFVSLHHLIEKYTKFIFNLLVKIISNTKNIHTLKINTYCNIKSISYENKKPIYQKLIYITIF